MKPGNYLSFDGGPSGLSGLPALYIVKEILERLKRDLKLDKTPLPCDWFGLFMGTGPGAVDAILLGRLRMPISEAIEAYKKLLPVLSVEPSKDEEERKRNSQAFETAFTQVLIDAGFSLDTLMLDDTTPKTAICTLRPTIATTPYIIRSYRVRGAPPPKFTILQATCASIASPSTFSSLVYGAGSKRLELTSAIVGFTNPTRELLREAIKAFGKETHIGAIVSIGVGETNIVDWKYASDTMTETGSPSQILASSERVHRDVETRFMNSGIYFRFNIGLKLEKDDIVSATSTYLEDEEWDKATTRLHQPLGSLTLDEINSVSTTTVTLGPRPSVVPHFIGREDILGSLHETIFSGSTPSDANLPTVSVLRGLGGSGKTQIALKLALEFESKLPGVPVYFLDASSETKLQDAYRAIIRSQSPTHRSGSYDDALAWLATRQKEWLVIMDNADDPTVNLFQYIPKSPHGHVMITTRNETYAGLAPNSSHHVDGLPPVEAISLLLQISRYEDNENSQKYANEIVEAVGYLPLAIAHASAYIGIHRCLPTYMKMYNQNKAKLLALHEHVLPEDYRTPVATTIQMSLERLSQGARDVIRVFAWMDAISIAHKIIQNSAEREFSQIDERPEEKPLSQQTVQQGVALMSIFAPTGQWREIEFNKLVQECMEYSLLRVSTQEDIKYYSMHTLVQSYLKIDRSVVRESRPHQLAIRLLGSAVTVHYDYGYLAYNRLLAPHIRLIEIADVIEAGDHTCFANVLEEQGSPLLASQHMEYCLKKRRQNLGEDDLSILTAMGRLAESYWSAGRAKDAMELEEKVLEMRKRLLGDGHLQTVKAMGNLALSYRDLGRHQDALELGETVLKMRKQLLGDSDPDTVLAMSNLALSYRDLGRHQDALELDETVLKMRKPLLGDDHPDTILAMSSLSVSYGDIGRYQDALELAETVLKMRKRLLGDDHPETVLAMLNLTASYNDLGRHQDALELAEIVLKIQKQQLGDDHRDTVLAMSNLDFTYRKLGRYQDSLELGEMMLKIQKQRLGDDHLDTLEAMVNLAISYSNLGRHQDALELEGTVLKMRKQLLGDNHLETLQAMGNLADSYRELKRHQDAMELEEKVLRMRRQLLGDDHLNTLEAMFNLAASYSHLERYQDALELEENVLKMRRQLLGNDHPDTVGAMNNLALTYRDLERHHDALELGETVLRMRKQLSGDDHPDTLEAMFNLAISYNNLGRHQDALELDEKVLRMRRQLLGDDHLDTLEAMFNLTLSYSNLGRHRDAFELEVILLKMREQLLGDDHPDTLQAMFNLAASYYNLGMYQNALELDEKAMQVRKEVLGEEHPDTLLSMWSLLFTMRKLGMDQQRLILLREALPLYEKVYGKEHSDTIRIQKWINKISPSDEKEEDLEDEDWGDVGEDIDEGPEIEESLS